MAATAPVRMAVDRITCLLIRSVPVRLQPDPTYYFAAFSSSRATSRMFLNP